MNTNSSVSRARLAILPAFKVYEELQNIASERDDSSVDEETEHALLRRQDPLINLALAQFGASPKVGAQLYFLSRTEEQKNPEYWRAVRQAVLRNKAWPPLDSGLKQSALTEDDIAELFQADDQLIISAALKNPAAKVLLSRLYNREKPFQTVSNELLVRYVYESLGNPCITEDDSSEFGPDMSARDLQEGIWNLVKTLPATEGYMQVLVRLILNVDPRHAHYPEEDPMPVLQRWQSVASTEKADSDTGGFPWSYTGGGRKADFCALIAALYGRYMTKTESGKYETINIGSVDSPDIVLRCAFYGSSFYGSIRTKAKYGTVKEFKERQTLLLSALRTAVHRDERAFIFAAMCDSSLFEDRIARAFLEKHLQGVRAFQRYWQRCKQIKSRRPDFDLAPVSEDGQWKLEEIGAIPAPTADQKRVQALEESLATVRKSLSTLTLRLELVLILLIGAMAMIWWRT